MNISVDVKQINGTAVDFGVGFRSTAQYSEYYFGIGDNGKWLVLKLNNGQSSALIALTSTGAIHQGLNSINTLEVDASGSHFSFYINGVRVGSASDSTFATGKQGLLVDPNSTGTGLEVVYTNFKITQWQ